MIFASSKANDHILQMIDDYEKNSNIAMEIYKKFFENKKNHDTPKRPKKSCYRPKSERASFIKTRAVPSMF